jgi:lysyl-tRNA synthetase class 1
MFLDKSGKKISKSAGNVFTPQVWFKYGSPQSLILLMLKRFVGTRGLSVTDIPNYMNEFDELEDIYFGKQQVSNTKELAKLTGLYQYCWWLNPPLTPGIHISYNMLAYLAKVAPEGKKLEFITEKLGDYGFKIDEAATSSLSDRIEFVTHWNQDYAEIKETSLRLKAKEREAISELVTRLETGVETEEAAQSVIFESARNNDVKPAAFFKILYLLLLGSPRGPRLGPYIITMGAENVVQTLTRVLKREVPRSSTK